MVFQAAVCSGMGTNPHFYGIMLIPLQRFVPTMTSAKQGRGLGELPQQGEAVGSVEQTWFEQAVVLLVSLRVCTWDGDGASRSWGCVHSMRYQHPAGAHRAARSLHSIPWHCTLPNPKLCPKTENPRITEAGKTLIDHRVQPMTDPCLFSPRKSQSATSSFSLDTSNNGDSTTSLLFSNALF